MARGLSRLNRLPRETQAVQYAGAEVLDHHVGGLEQLGEDRLALLALEVQGDAALVAVEHGEVKAVGVRHIAQLSRA